MFKIVQGSLLTGTVNGENETGFYGSNRKTEAEYKQLIIDSQKYFKGIIEGTISPSEKYFIYAPAYFLTHNYASDIADA